MELGLSVYSGSEFLMFYGGLIVAAVIAGIWIPGFLRDEGRRNHAEDIYELSYLAGGTTRLAEAAIARLMGIGALKVSSKDQFSAIDRRGAEAPVERSIMSNFGAMKWKDAHQAAKEHADAIDARLVQKGLLIDKSGRWQLRLIPLLPYVIVLLLGWYRLKAGEALGEPTGYLTLLMLLAAILAMLRLIKFNPRTRAGDEILREEQKRASRLKSAPTGPETGMAVGLFGTGVLVGSPFADFHTLRRASSGDGSSDGGCGGGGCGGGCGGCGG